MNPPVVEAAAPATFPQPTPQRRRCAFTPSTVLCCRGRLPPCVTDRYERQYFFLLVMTNPLWRFLMCCCILLLLFGSQIQDLWCDKNADQIWNILYTVSFGVFCLDITFRIIVVPGYLGCNFANLRRQFHNWRNPDHYRLEEDSFAKFYIGSFLFWCDLISTLSMLYNISFINTTLEQYKTVDIFLDRFFLPINGQVNKSIPLAGQPFLFVTIGKTFRIVRFVRSTRVEKIVGRVNWYWPLQIINPRNIRNYWCGSQKNKQGGDSSADGTGNSTSTNNGKNKAGGGKKGDEASKNPQLERNAASNYGDGVESANQGNPDMMRRRSWGGLGRHALAAVKAHSLAKAEQERQGKMFFGKVKKILWEMGLVRNDRLEWQRQLAATKIQRAWRSARNYQQPERDEDYAAWRSTSLRSAASAFRKHSIMKHYTSGKLSIRQPRPVDRSGGGSTSGEGTGGGTDGTYFGRRGNESQVGGAMRELTGQRVAVGIIFSLILTVVFTYLETDASREATMMVLHRQTTFTGFAFRSLEAARYSSIPDLYKYEFGNDNQTIKYFEPLTGEDENDLRNRETFRISVSDITGRTTVGWFAYRDEVRYQALGELLSTVFILLIWLFGVTAFAGPVLILVVLPIERMVRLLGMLMVDPLGYQSTSRYRKFCAEADSLTKNTRWTKEVLKGMETSFLMSTILRIGSLMKVGFGSAGVEIIRQNLQKKQGGNVNLLTSQGTTVSCIFLFCDVRQFTDATECLQEEVFVFTNRIAAVVHSFCHSYGGSANKNIGDAFLCSWLLDDPNSGGNSSSRSSSSNKDGLCANNNQADKCLLCVVKICMALHHDSYYVETMSDGARERLLAKLSTRPGPIVQMGCGLHAGKAVQGAIGSERKIDATYVSEAVEMAEFLESSTKKYGVNMLMSDSFHRLLHSSNRYRCRIVDQIVIEGDDGGDDEIYDGDVLELYTYDINIDALWEVPAPPNDANMDKDSDTESFNDRIGSRRELKNLSLRGRPGKLGKGRNGRRMSISRLSGKSTPDITAILGEELKADTSASFGLAGNVVATGPLSSSQVTPEKAEAQPFVKPELVLPTGPALYNANIWRSETMLKIRLKYSDGLFFHKFNSGLQSFYAQDWDHAKQCFQGILDDCFDDGPSKYFMSQIEQYNGKPPPNFRPYGIA